MRTKLMLPAFLWVQIFCAQSADPKNQLRQHELEIKELSRQVQYYKNALNVNQAIRSVTFENIRFDVTQVIGSKKDGTVEVNFLYTNVGPTLRSLQCERALMVDPKGNQHLTTQMYIAPNGRIVANEVLPKTAYRGGVLFKKQNSYLPTIRSLALYIYPRDNFSNPVPVVFENIPVIWQ